MMNVLSGYKQPLTQILRWNIETYCDPDAQLDEFKLMLTRILDMLEASLGTDDVALDDKHIIWVKEAIENARNYWQECGVPKEDVDMLWRWILPKYLKR